MDNNNDIEIFEIIENPELNHSVNNRTNGLNSKVFKDDFKKSMLKAFVNMDKCIFINWTTIQNNLVEGYKEPKSYKDSKNYPDIFHNWLGSVGYQKTKIVNFHKDYVDNGIHKGKGITINLKEKVLK
jgi:hypothetical protein